MQVVSRRFEADKAISFTDHYGQQRWQLNEDYTISPLLKRDVVVGWRDSLCLVDRDSDKKIQLFGYWVNYDDAVLRDNNTVVATVPNGRLKLNEIKQRIVDQQLSSFSQQKILNSRDTSVTLSKSETIVSRGNLVDCEGSVTHVY